MASKGHQWPGKRDIGIFQQRSDKQQSSCICFDFKPSIETGSSANGGAPEAKSSSVAGSSGGIEAMEDMCIESPVHDEIDGNINNNSENDSDNGNDNGDSG